MSHDLVILKLTCANGSRWGAKGCGPCRKCRREAARMDREFCLDVLLGKYVNQRGYTAAEWKAYCEKIAEREGAGNTNRAPHQVSRVEATHHG